jgi:hypothetical protein
MEQVTLQQALCHGQVGRVADLQVRKDNFSSVPE